MKTMLIVSDSRVITGELAMIFQSEYVVYTCNRYDDALLQLHALKPDVLIINLSLSHMTGLEVLQQAEYTPPVIIALTYYLSDSIIQEAQECGAGALIRLPCFAKCIAAHLAKLTHHKYTPPETEGV